MMRWVLLAAMLLVPFASLAVYPIKYDSQEIQDNIRLLQRDIEQERVTVDILRAEWSYLTRPERLQELTQEILTLAPVGIESMGFHVEDLPYRTANITEATQ